MATEAALLSAIANAVKASGVIVKVNPADFEAILHKIEKPLVICATGGLIRSNYQYLTSYKGFAFFTKSPVPLELPPKIETVLADQIWIPN